MRWIISLMLVMTMAACSSSIEKEVTEEFRDPVSEVLDPQVIYSDQAEIKIKIVGPRMLVHEGKEPYMEFPDGLRIYFYDKNAELTSKIRADYAIRKENEQKTILQKDVWFISSGGDKMNTEELVWDEATGKLYSEKKVTVGNNLEVIEGNRFEALQDFSWWRIDEITGILNVANYKATEDF